MERKLLFKNAASLSVVQIANYVLPLISVPIVTRVLGPDKFGIISYAATFITYFNILITYGFDLTATRIVAKNSTDTEQANVIFNKVFRAKLALFSISVVLFILCLNLIPPLYKEREVAIFSFLFCFGTLMTQNWLFAAMQDLPKIAVFELINKIILTISIIIVIKIKEDYRWFPLITSLVQVAGAVVTFWWSVKKYELHFIAVSVRDVYLLLTKEFTVFFSILLISLYTTTNIVVLGLFKDSEQIGFYTGGQKLIIVVCSIVNIPLAQVLFPFFGKSFAEDYKKGLMNVQRILPFVVLFTGSIGFIIVIAGPWLLKTFYGNAFSPSAMVFQLLAFNPLFIALSGIFGTQIMLNLSLDKLFMKITLIAAIVSIFLNFLLINRYGYIGTALNWLCTEALVAVIMYVALRSKGIDPIDIKQFNICAVGIQIKPLVKYLITRFT